jgi:translation initiation factor IF-2
MDARVERGAGVVADCVVRWGTLKRGDYVISGIHGGKVKSLSDSKCSRKHLISLLYYIVSYALSKHCHVATFACKLRYF